MLEIVIATHNLLPVNSCSKKFASTSNPHLFTDYGCPWPDGICLEGNVKSRIANEGGSGCND